MGTIVACSVVALPMASSAQSSTIASSLYRVFLTDGQALPAYGASTRVGDRVVFNLSLAGTNDATSLQLVSLPESAVDLDRTARYAEALQAAEYAATRGDREFAAMSEEVARALTELEKVNDLPQRRALAALARQRLLDWSRAHYSHRAPEIQEFAGMFDDVSRDTRVGAGDRSLSVDLVAGPPIPVREPLRATPDLRESIEMALAAVAASDAPDERLAILHAAAVAAGDGRSDLAAAVAERVNDERRSAAAYAALGSGLRARADVARRRGDGAAIERLRIELADRDRALGSRRPDDVAAVARDLSVAIDAAHAYRLALDHYAYIKPALLAYERRVRPALAVLAGHAVLLTAIRDMRTVGFAEVDAARASLMQVEARVRDVVAPEELAGVHRTIVSALEMAREAVGRRRQAVITNTMQTAREASSAAAGALLLAEAVRRDLVTGLYPPKPGD